MQSLPSDKHPREKTLLSPRPSRWFARQSDGLFWQTLDYFGVKMAVFFGSRPPLRVPLMPSFLSGLHATLWNRTRWVLRRDGSPTATAGLLVTCFAVVWFTRVKNPTWAFPLPVFVSSHTYLYKVEVWAAWSGRKTTSITYKRNTVNLVQRLHPELWGKGRFSRREEKKKKAKWKTVNDRHTTRDLISSAGNKWLKCKN